MRDLFKGLVIIASGLIYYLLVGDGSSSILLIILLSYFEFRIRKVGLSRDLSEELKYTTTPKKEKSLNI